MQCMQPIVVLWDNKCRKYLPIYFTTLGQGLHSYTTKISLVLHTWQCQRNVYPSADHSSSELLATPQSPWTFASSPAMLAVRHSPPPSGCLSRSYCNRSINIPSVGSALAIKYRNLQIVQVTNQTSSLSIIVWAYALNMSHKAYIMQMQPIATSVSLAMLNQSRYSLQGKLVGPKNHLGWECTLVPPRKHNCTIHACGNASLYQITSTTC